MEHLLKYLSVVIVAAAARAARADDLLPVVAASIHDAQHDGTGDSFNTAPFTGLLRETATQEDRAILEYDVSAYASQTIQSATISGQISVNNAFDNGPRTFDFIIYSANGQADLADFQIAGTIVGSGSYHPPADTSFSFSFDVTSAVQAVIGGGAAFVGLKVDPTSNPNFPNILSGSTHLTLVTGSTCNACDANCDQSVNAQDVPAFVSALLLGGSGCSSCRGDTNHDGNVDGTDIAAFVQCLMP